MSVGIPMDYRRVRLDVTLVHSRSVELALDDYVRRGEAGFNVSFFESESAREITWLTVAAAELLRHYVFVQQRCVLARCVENV